MREYYRIKIERDDNPMDPRDSDNLGTMLCWHRNYKLGDENVHKHREPHEAMLSIIHDSIDANFGDQLDEKDLERRDYIAAINEEFEKHHVVLPLFLYDHSGITMSTGSFGCRWDSGQVGFIYISHKKAHEEFGGPEFLDKTVWTPAKQQRCVEALKGEVKTYDQYITNDVYGFTVEKLVYQFEIPVEEVDVTNDNLPWEFSDSCWGFFGDVITGDRSNGITHHVGYMDAARVAAVKDAMNNLESWVELPPSPVEGAKTHAA